MPAAEGHRTGTNRSEVWNYFTETVGGAKCKLCGQIRVRSDKSTKTMHDHLRTAHKDINYQKAYPNRKPARIVTVRPPKSVSESKSVTTNVVAHTKKVEIEADKHILYLILRCAVDFDVILSAPELSSLIATVYPSYKLKPRLHYGNIVSEREASRFSTITTSEAQNTFFSLTADWLSNDNAGLITLSSHYLNEDYSEVSGVFMANALCPSTSELDVAERLRQRLKDLHLDINKLVAIVHNGEFSDISRLLNVQSFECGARVISNVMQSALGLDCVQLIIARARTLIESYKKYSKTKTFFHDHTLKLDSNWVRLCETLTSLVVNAVTLNSLTEDMVKKETNIRLTLEDDEAEVFSQLSIILLTFKEEAIRLSRDSASAYFPTFLKLKSFIDNFNFTPGSVVETFVNQIRLDMTRICDEIRTNKFLVLCTVLDPRFRNRLDYQSLPWGNIESEFLDFALSCALKVPLNFEKPEEEPNQNYNQILELMLHSDIPQQQFNEPRQPLAGTNNEQVQIAESTSPIKVDPEPEVSSTTSLPQPEVSQPPKTVNFSAQPVNIWQTDNSVKEEHDLNFRLSFSVNLKCELDQFGKIEPVDRSSSVTNWWQAHSNEFPRLKKFARILHSIPATAICSKQLFGPDPVDYASKLLKWFGNKSSANCLLVRSHMSPFQRLSAELELSKSEDDS